MQIITLFEQFLEYKQFIQGISPMSVKRYREQLKYFFKHSRVNNISEVTQQMIFSFFIYGRTERNWSPWTFQTYFISLHVFFKWCVQRGYMEKDFTDDIDKPRIPKSLPKSLSKEDAEKLLEIIYNYPYSNSFLRYRNHAIFAVFIFTGLRKKELLNLKLADVNVENNTVFVRHGKGGKDRIIPINSSLNSILRKYLKERDKKKYYCPYFFVSSLRDRELSEHGLKHFVNLIKNISPISFTLHALRHTFATLMLEGGCDVFSLSKMLGHSDIKTTTIYLSVSAEHLRSQVVKHPMNQRTSDPAVLSYNFPS